MVLRCKPVEPAEQNEPLRGAVRQSLAVRILSL
jgi:hypothetical protein